MSDMHLNFGLICHSRSRPSRHLDHSRFVAGRIFGGHGFLLEVG